MQSKLRMDESGSKLPQSKECPRYSKEPIRIALLRPPKLKFGALRNIIGSIR